MGSNLELMRTLDDAWNSQDLETFNSRHADDVVVRWPGRPETHGRRDHEAEAVAFTDLRLGGARTLRSGRIRPAQRVARRREKPLERGRRRDHGRHRTTRR